MLNFTEQLKLRARQCSQCDYEWLLATGDLREEPERCPNHACRSRRWSEPKDGGVKVVVEKGRARKAAPGEKWRKAS